MIRFFPPYRHLRFAKCTINITETQKKGRQTRNVNKNYNSLCFLLKSGRKGDGPEIVEIPRPVRATKKHLNRRIYLNTPHAFANDIGIQNSLTRCRKIRVWSLKWPLYTKGISLLEILQVGPFTQLVVPRLIENPGVHREKPEGARRIILGRPSGFSTASTMFFRPCSVIHTAQEAFC